MKTDRRSFLGALLVAPFVPRIAAAMTPLPAIDVWPRIDAAAANLAAYIDRVYTGAIRDAYPSNWAASTFVAREPIWTFDIPDDVGLVTEASPDGTEWVSFQ